MPPCRSCGIEDFRVIYSLAYPAPAKEQSLRFVPDFTERHAEHVYSDENPVFSKGEHHALAITFLRPGTDMSNAVCLRLLNVNVNSHPVH